MKCRDAKTWIYSCRPNASWPADLVAHLQECAACQSLRGQLTAIDQAINQLTSTPGGADLQAKILSRIETTPQTPAPVDGGPEPHWQWSHIGLYLSGAAALILFGWFLGHGEHEVVTIKTVEVVQDRLVDVFRDKIVLVNAPADRNLFTVLLKRNARLVQTSAGQDRLELLLDMADDCRLHALNLIEQGPRDSLPLAIELYAQVLREGVLPLLAQAPVEDRPGLQMTARSRLEKMGTPPAAAAQSLPKVVADQRAAMQAATQQTIECVLRPEAAPMAVRPRLESTPPAALLVRYAVTYCSERDPVAKADSCAACVQQLMPHMMLYLAEDSTPQRGEMGQQFGEMIQHGVYVPLELATAKEPVKQVQEQANRIFDATDKALTDIEKNLQQAPDASKVGILRIFEATKKGWEYNKGKGPPWKRAIPEQKPGKGRTSLHPHHAPFKLRDSIEHGSVRADHSEYDNRKRRGVPPCL